MPNIKRSLLISWIVLSAVPGLGRDSGNLILPILPGNTLTSQPFGFDIATPELTSTRYQQVFAASGFTSTAPLGGTITRIAFEEARYDVGAGYPELQINFSVTDVQPDNLSSIYADNLGNTVTTVFEPKRFDFGVDDWSLDGVGIILNSPFFYDPQQGNLLMEIWINGSPIRSSYEALQAENTLGDTVSRVYGGTADSASGTADSIGLVTWFTIEPIPEPSPLVLFLAVGSVALTWSIFLKRNSAKP